MLLATNTEFELRPAPSDHLAAVLLCAPEFLGLRETCRLDAPAGLDLTPASSLEICEALSSNARFIATFLYTHSHSFKSQSQSKITSAIQLQLNECVNVLHKRFQRAMLAANKLRAPGDAPNTAASASIGAGVLQQHPRADVHTNLLQLAIKDASLVVSSNALARASPSVLAGVPAQQVFLRAFGGDPLLGAKLLWNMHTGDF